jgi:hypothetical protein
MKSSEKPASHRPVPEGIELRGTGESDYPRNARELAKSLEHYLGEERDDILGVYRLFAPVTVPAPAEKPETK